MPAAPTQIWRLQCRPVNRCPSRNSTTPKGQASASEVPASEALALADEGLAWASVSVSVSVGVGLGTAARSVPLCQKGSVTAVYDSYVCVTAPPMPTWSPLSSSSPVPYHPNSISQRLHVNHVINNRKTVRPNRKATAYV